MKEEWVIKNGKLLTMDGGRRADWIAVSGGKIKDLGTGDGYRAYLSPSTAVIDAGGCTVLPGFIDNHFHLVITALGAQWVSLEGVRNFRGIGKRLNAAQAKIREDH